jgi:hypothetical protein
MSRPAIPSLGEIAQRLIDAADEERDHALEQDYWHEELLRETAADLLKYAAGIGSPHVSDLAVGDPVTAKVWMPAKITWLGDMVCYVETEDGVRHKVDRFESHLRKKP